MGVLSVKSKLKIITNKSIYGYLLDANPSPQTVASKIEEFYQLSAEQKMNKRKAAYDTWDTKYNAEKNYVQFVDDILAL